MTNYEYAEIAEVPRTLFTEGLLCALGGLRGDRIPISLWRATTTGDTRPYIPIPASPKPTAPSVAKMSS